MSLHQCIKKTTLSSGYAAQCPWTQMVALLAPPFITLIPGTRDSYGVAEPKLWNEDLRVFLFDPLEVRSQSFLVPYAGYFPLDPSVWALIADVLPLFYTP